MADEFSHKILIRVVAQICEMIGFHQTTMSALTVLADVLQEYLLKLGLKTRQYAEHSGRSTVDLSDLSLSFYDLNISPQELVQFYQAVGPLPASLVVPKYPVPKSDQPLLHCSQQSSQHNDQVVVNVEKTRPLEESNRLETKDALKIKISLSKIKVLSETKKSKSKKKKKKKKKKT